MTEQHATPLVRKLAAQHSIDLGTVTGTGIAGRVTPADVRAAAVAKNVDPDARALAQSSRVPDDKLLALTGSGVDGKIIREDVDAYVARRAVVELQANRPIASAPESGPFALNPLAEEARASRPKAHAAAMTEGPKPSLFVSGDLPVYMVSGADPQLLLKLPWQARHPAARATASELADMFETYGGPDGPLGAELELGNHPENLAYADRVKRWVEGPPYDWTVERSPARQAADEETYQLLFGEEDRRRAQAKADAAQDLATKKRREAEDQARAQERAQRR